MGTAEGADGARTVGTMDEGGDIERGEGTGTWGVTRIARSARETPPRAPDACTPSNLDRVNGYGGGQPPRARQRATARNERQEGERRDTGSSIVSSTRTPRLATRARPSGTICSGVIVQPRSEAAPITPLRSEPRRSSPSHCAFEKSASTRLQRRIAPGA